MGGCEEEGAEIKREGKRALARLEYSSAGGTAVIKLTPKNAQTKNAKTYSYSYSYSAFVTRSSDLQHKLIFTGKMCQEAARTPKPDQDDVIRICMSKILSSRSVCNSLYAHIL